MNRSSRRGLIQAAATLVVVFTVRRVWAAVRTHRLTRNRNNNPADKRMEKNVMAESTGIFSRPNTGLPPDDLQRMLLVAKPDTDQSLQHLGVVGDTYTTLITGDDTNGRFCLVDMHIPPEGGPPPHRHDFEETFIVLDGELELTFRGKKLTAGAGTTVNIPSNAPHQFHNSSNQPVRALLLCSPAGQENLFAQVGIPVATRTTAPPEEGRAAQIKKTKELAPKFRTELLEHA